MIRQVALGEEGMHLEELPQMTALPTDGNLDGTDEWGTEPDDESLPGILSDLEEESRKLNSQQNLGDAVNATRVTERLRALVCSGRIGEISAQTAARISTLLERISEGMDTVPEAPVSELHELEDRSAHAQFKRHKGEITNELPKYITKKVA